MEITSEPDNQFDAYLSHPDCKAVLCDVHMWMPRGNHTDMRIDVFANYSSDLELLMGRECQLICDTYEARKSFEFIASGVYIKSVFMKNPGRKVGRARIELSNISDIAIKNFLTGSSDIINHLNFPLSNLNFATPIEPLVPDYRGQLLIKEGKSYAIYCPQYGGYFAIKKHANWVHHTSNEKGVYRFPVLVWNSESPVKKTNLPALEKLADDVALLVTFAARHRTVVLGCNYECSAERYQKFRNPIDRNKSPNEEIQRNELIPLEIFEGFMSSAIECWANFSEDIKQSIRQIIVALHPLTESSSARDYLALFSAFEGFVSCVNEADGSISGGDWKKVEKYLRCCIDRSKSISSENKVIIKQKLPELKRESLEGKVRRFFDDKEIFVGDLWPLFDKERSSLTEIRNRLAHGDGFNNANYDLLIAARELISVLLERVVIRCLGGCMSKTRACQQHLVSKYYFYPDRVIGLREKLKAAP
jgi:hypothetical protein